MSIPQSDAPVAPSVVAALLLVAREPLQQLGLPAPTATKIMEVTGAGRSRAYELSEALRAMLPGLSRRVGRPAAAPAAEPAMASKRPRELTLAVLRLVTQNPGCVSAGSERERMSYTDAFRLGIVELRRQYADLELEVFARAADVPLGTLKGWLVSPSEKNEGVAAQDDATASETPADRTPTCAPSSAVLQTVLLEWKHWRGGFIDFCEHVQRHCRVSLGRSAISTLLETEGVRVRARRPGRSPDEQALRHSFETFFPGAQWVGDGSTISVDMNQEHFSFNLELMVDAYSGAFVGLSVRDNEDGAAVTTAFDAGVATTGAPPLALLLDNRASNHAPEVDEKLGKHTLRMRSTPGRAQNKAHAEGAFGLFSQTVPALCIAAASPRQLAAQILELVATTWARAMNQRPRRDRGGRSRAELYQDNPTGEQIAQARAALLERHRKQELARQTRIARLDPTTRLLLDEAFARLALADPEHHFRAALARYGRDAIVEGIATFESKGAAGTLPVGVDARYLLGIVRNIAADNELHELTEALIQNRLRARELALRVLDDERCLAEEHHTEPAARIAHHADRAATSERKIDRLFWLAATSNAVIDCACNDTDACAEWLRFASARFQVATALPARDRAELVRSLTRRVLPAA